MNKVAVLAGVVSTAVLVVGCGGGDGNPNASASNGGASNSGSLAQPAAPTDALDAACLTSPSVGQQITATVTIGPPVEIGNFRAKAIGKTDFDGGSYDTLEVKRVERAAFDWGTGANDTRLHFDPASPIFLHGVTEYAYGDKRKYTKYRRFTYTDATTGQTGVPNLVGMKPNEMRSFKMVEANGTGLPTDPQPALDEIRRTVNVSVQYIGREDVTAKGVTYKGACKLALRYERKGIIYLPMPVLEGTVWLAPNAGLVKLSGAPLVGVDMVTAETTGIVASN